MRYVIFSEGNCPLLDISAIGYAKNIEVTRFGPGQRNEYIIHYVLSGKGYFNGKSVTAGHGFLITPGMLEEYYPDEKDPWEFLWVTSRDIGMERLYEYYHRDDDTHIFKYHEIQAVRKVAERVVLNTNTRCGAFEMLEMFLGIFREFAGEQKSGKNQKSMDIYAEAAVNYINANLYNSITVQELTQIIGVSQPYLFRIFKEKFGKSPKQYISDSKVAYAKQLLRETDLTITQIAASVGFVDVMTFSKFFAAHVGMSPRKYREHM